jgi:hypothetical protein
MKRHPTPRIRYDDALRKTVGLVLAGMIFWLGAERAEAISIRVSQETSPGNSVFKVLGYITPFDGLGQTAAQYYDYGGVGGNAASYGNTNASTILAADTTSLFTVNTQEGLSLFVVHSAPNVPASNGIADMQFNLAGGNADILAHDDPVTDPQDIYSGSAGGTVFTSHHVWQGGNTDGLAIGPLGNAFPTYAEFTAPPSGLNAWVAISNGGSTIPLVLESGLHVRLDLVPEPSTFVLGIAGLAGLGFVAKRKVLRLA